MTSRRASLPLLVLGALVGVAVLALVVTWYWNHLQARREVEDLLEQARESQDFLKDPSAAKVALQKVVKIDPSLWEAHYRLGLATLALDQVGESILHFEEALSRAPGERQAAIYLQLGQGYRRRFEGTANDRDFRMARSSFQSATEDRETEAQALHGLGVLWMNESRRDYARALEYLEELVEKYPDYPDHARVREIVGLLRQGLGQAPP